MGLTVSNQISISHPLTMSSTSGINCSLLPAYLRVISSRMRHKDSKKVLLQCKDLKFSRALLPLLYGYAEGLTWEITALLVMLGANLDKVKVEVSIDKPQSLSRAMVTGLDEAVQSVDALIKSFNEATKGPDFGRGGGGFGGGDEEPAPKIEFMKPEKWVAIMRAMTGMPYSLLHAIANIDKKADVPDIPVSEQLEYILEETHHYTCTSDNVIQMWDASPRLIQEHQFKENWLKAA